MTWQFCNDVKGKFISDYLSPFGEVTIQPTVPTTTTPTTTTPTTTTPTTTTPTTTTPTTTTPTTTVPTVPTTTTPVPAGNGRNLAMFYCGFGGDFCGQSTYDDVNHRATTVILAFSNTVRDGSIVVDTGNWPTTMVSKWQAAGKKVLISVGGQNGVWDYIFESETNEGNFVRAVVDVISKYSLDGIDLDIEAYHSPPSIVARMINNLRAGLTAKFPVIRKQIVVSPECVAVYQGSGVPDANVGGNPFNYFVPIINLADAAIDFYQVQAYNNWYDGVSGGSLDYLKNVYLNWRNLQGLGQWGKPIPNFNGVAGNKLLMGVLASTSAGGAAYYAPPAIITSFKNFL